MKNINYIISGILGAAVIALFVLHFTGETGVAGDPTGTDGSENRKSDPVRTDGTLNIAYFEVDSVLANWDLYYEIQEQLESKQKQLESEFESKTNSFRKRVEDAQYKMQRGLVTRAEADQLQQQLASEEQNLMGLQSNYAQQLQEEGMVKNRQMIDMIEQYLKQYNEDKGYSFIFSYSFGGNLLYGADAYNITDEVIDGINQVYPPKEN
ncbi:MAG: OmpH family outer membrane protein [Bacteroidales bacterium]